MSKSILMGKTIGGVVALLLLVTSSLASEQDERDFRLKSRHVSIHVNADGSSVIERSQLTELLTQQAVEWFGEDKLVFSSSREQAQILQAYTELADGKRFEIDSKAIRLVQADDAESSSTYSDHQAYVVIFPHLAPGAKTYLRSRVTEHTPLYPGHFFATSQFGLGSVYENVTIDLSHDPRINLQFEISPNKPQVKVQKLPTQKDGFIRYRFTYSNLDPVRVDHQAVSGLDIKPYVRISSIPSMLDTGRLYQQSSTPREVATAQIRKLSDEITAGLTDPREQAKAIYNWVTTQIRYIGIYLGDGGVVPNYAEDILRNRYGDCKDHNTLLIALLAAKGIRAESALINSGDSFKLPELGAIAPFNHVITYLPDWDLYVDSTDRQAPFGVLSYSVSDKPTVLTQSLVYGRTPKSRTSTNRLFARVQMKIDHDGVIKGESSISLTGPMSLGVRAYLMDYQGPSKDEMPVRQLAKFDQVGTGRYSFEPMGDLNNPVEYDATFSVEPITNFPGPGAMWMPVGLALGRIANWRWHSPDKKQEHPFVCRSYSYEEHYSLQLPDSVKVTHLPQHIEYFENGYGYRSRYVQNDNRIDLVRELTVDLAADVCQPGQEKLYNRLLEVVQKDLRGQILYAPVKVQ